MKQMKHIIFAGILGIFAVCMIISMGCVAQTPAENTTAEKYCSSDADCACGRHVTTSDCFYGNKQYVNVSQQCPDYCTGIAANLEISCVNNTCIQRQSQPIGMANPASVYCKEHGGTIEIREFTAGQAGFCKFDDGSECDEWAYFRNECAPGEKFCKDYCGDGECAEVVCMAVGCPCAETHDSCPEDCP